ncbi:MAG: amidophosphoribosyltransferase [Kistimonas sp.]|nr:amidophosphoribosyltransferase [Kistimonas sp.]
MCGIVGIVASQMVKQLIYDALTLLQHRGQDAAGIMTCHQGRFHLRKGNGLVKDVFHDRHMQQLHGSLGIGHVRYPTAGSSSSAESQPFFVNSPYGIALAHNGNLVNAEQLRTQLCEQGRRHINTGSDSEVLLNALAHTLESQGGPRLEPQQIFSAISRVFDLCQGGYAAVALINGRGLVCFRDAHGIRPLVYGRRRTATGVDYMVASESVALTALGFEPVRDVRPGEAMLFTPEGQVHSHQCARAETVAPCIFEYVYFARPDSTLNGISVYSSRLRMGRKLAARVLAEWPDQDIDVVMPVPDSSRPAAMEMARCLNVDYREGLVKNRYIGRTFIMPGQQERKKSVRQKLNAIALEFKGRNVMLVDDSIVRGTTSRQIIQMAREAGARRVYLSSAAPAVRYPNVYGIDLPEFSELIAEGRSVSQIAALIGADRLFYQTLPDLIEAVRESNPEISSFDCSVFDGVYVAGDITESFLSQLCGTRSEADRQTPLVSEEDQVEMYDAVSE